MIAGHVWREIKEGTGNKIIDKVVSDSGLKES